MSIHDAINDAVSDGRLHLLQPLARGAAIRRVLLLEDSLWSAVTNPRGDPEWLERVGRLRADLEVFVTAHQITPKYLFLLYKAIDAVWEIRSARDLPQLRVLGSFADMDVLVLSVLADREKLGGWDSREWRAAKRAAKAAWRRLVFTYPPVVTTKVDEVCGGCINGIYYKERD